MSNDGTRQIDTRPIVTSAEAVQILRRLGSPMSQATLLWQLKQGYDRITRTSYIYGIPMARNRSLGEDIPRWDVLVAGLEQYAGMTKADDDPGHSAESANHTAPVGERQTYSVIELANLLGCDEAAIRRQVDESKGVLSPDIRGLAIGGQWLFPKRPVDRWLGIDDAHDD